MAQSYIAALESWSRTGCEASPGCVVSPCIKKPREEGGRKRRVREGTREERRIYGISLQPLRHSESRTWTFVDFGNSSWNKFPKDIKWQQYTLVYFFYWSVDEHGAVSVPWLLWPHCSPRRNVGASQANFFLFSYIPRIGIAGLMVDIVLTF